MFEKGYVVPALRDPVLPPAASWFPLPLGWDLLICGLLLLAIALCITRYARWRRNRWRREALGALAQPQTIDSWLQLIKRIQLVHRPRQEMSRALAPKAVLAPIAIDDDLRRQMIARYCRADNALSDEQSARLRRQLARWLKELPNV
ncbi:DUF4381 family protein [Raoultella terrigena]|jgi:aryl carrier-like protein|uniref:DUF4381 family protein n=1 Tax=Raoultella terrigena TaxID=577 RepID=UPI000F472C62|nr:DUF4381 family protein [Raoultella terrigena]ROS22371.1 uncharacterized protein DUF4381 [Raoultella terrigena]